LPVFSLMSPAFEDGQELAQKYGKEAGNVSPPLEWEDTPQGTRSFALTLVDIHPIARNYVHWLVADISPRISSLPEAVTGDKPQHSPRSSPTLAPSRRMGHMITSSRFTPSAPTASVSRMVPACRYSRRPPNANRWPLPR
jgi:phosphatidylethanolamine-binding protein (PEBP) family uncharacterized protein